MIKLITIISLVLVLFITTRVHSLNFNSFSKTKQYSNLANGKWIKFISGASNHDSPFIKNLCYLYTLSGVDCIDLSADLAVLQAAKEGIDKGIKQFNYQIPKPLIMVSVNIEQEVHFRKASFDPMKCPIDCPRPCEKVCPASAITTQFGVNQNKCYGCGRCPHVCPIDLITMNAYKTNIETLSNLLTISCIDAIEIHLAKDNLQAFESFWHQIGDLILNKVQILSLSFPNCEKILEFMNNAQSIILRSSSWKGFQGIQIWQTDGRPMSGDMSTIGTKATIEFAKTILTNQNLYQQSLIQFQNGKHFVQIAGGTNNFSGRFAKESNLSQLKGFGGFAFGGYARKTLNSYFQPIYEKNPTFSIENYPLEYNESLKFAQNLVNSVRY